MDRFPRESSVRTALSLAGGGLDFPSYVTTGGSIFGDGDMLFADGAASLEAARWTKRNRNRKNMFNL
jgi:hypothetical protein